MLGAPPNFHNSIFFSPAHKKAAGVKKEGGAFDRGIAQPQSKP
jgi:hypothetical protein